MGLGIGFEDKGDVDGGDGDGESWLDAVTGGGMCFGEEDIALYTF